MKTRFVALLLSFSAVWCATARPGMLPIWLSASQAAQVSKANGADEKTIRELINELSDDSFDKRETAHKKLLVIGGPALELLKKAKKDSGDAETRERAAEIIEAIQETGLVGF